MKTVLIDSRDLSYTIDTYGTFTMENEAESEIDYLMENDETLTNENFDDRYEAHYDMEGYRRHLAQCSVDLLTENVVNYSEYVEIDSDNRKLMKHNIVTDITLGDTRSPRFYNYTTDSYTATWTYDEYLLEKYCSERSEQFDKFVKENWDFEWSEAIEKDDTDALATVKLDFYTRETYSEDDYVDEMYERQQGYEYIKFTPVKEVVK